MELLSNNDKNSLLEELIIIFSDQSVTQLTIQEINIIYNNITNLYTKYKQKLITQVENFKDFWKIIYRFSILIFHPDKFEQNKIIFSHLSRIPLFIQINITNLNNIFLKINNLNKYINNTKYHNIDLLTSLSKEKSYNYSSTSQNNNSTTSQNNNTQTKEKDSTTSQNNNTQTKEKDSTTSQNNNTQTKEKEKDSTTSQNNNTQTKEKDSTTSKTSKLFTQSKEKDIKTSFNSTFPTHTRTSFNSTFPTHTRTSSNSTFPTHTRTSFNSTFPTHTRTSSNSTFPTHTRTSSKSSNLRSSFVDFDNINNFSCNNNSNEKFNNEDTFKKQGIVNKCSICHNWDICNFVDNYEYCFRCYNNTNIPTFRRTNSSPQLTHVKLDFIFCDIQFEYHNHNYFF